MSILNRFATIMSSNFNAVLDKLEDPSKMIDQILRDLDKELNNVKSQTAAVMADEARARRQLDELVEDINKMEEYAGKAVLAGNDSDALKFLQEKSRKEQNLESANQSLRIAEENSAKMKQMHDKLQGQIKELNDRKSNIKANIAAANAQDKINRLTSDTSSVSMDSFRRMEEKAQRMLDEANARQQLSKDDSLPDMSKYDNLAAASKAEDALAALKAKLGAN